ncbi:MAG: deoxyribonucleoside 5'-monophosphate N-glycosidase [Chloroflexi bacterium]|nr:deoxyribonucleoside 5'-monophosphate N-glycosidase [Chloroflexota bacterium]
MNIYFACSITGGRADESIYTHLVNALQADGHEVPTADIAGPAVHMAEHVHTPEFVYERDVEWIRACDALVAEVSTPSHGVGYEIAYALEHSKPVLCLYREGVTVSKMITGNHRAGLIVQSYKNENEASGLIISFLSSL